MLVTILLLLFTLLYLGLICSYLYAWQRIPLVREGFPGQEKTVSIVIAARNEGLVIGACIRSLLQQNYPSHLLEFVIVDDDSTDNTAMVINGFSDKRIRYFRLAAPEEGQTVYSYKKRALTAGIANATGEWILTTDADCICPQDWVLSIAAQFDQQNVVMLVAPVRFLCSGSLLESFQQFDFMTMQGITAAVRYLDWGVMCNGANLAFQKKAFEAVEGYKGVDHIASGDDYLLMLKMRQQFPGQIAYVKSPDAAVDTAPQPSWPAFVQQRLRWASKSGKYADPAMGLQLSLVFGFNFLLLFSLFFAGVEQYLLIVWSICLLLKIAIELLFLKRIDRVYPIRASLFYFPLLQPIHIIYIILIGLTSRFLKFQWKDRTVQAQ
jgi:cellulose synthase/poly-beta-1,6-N-acetylglucosamine synthase-like glycosyltransferase